MVCCFFVFFVHALHAQKQVLVTLDSGVLETDTTKNNPHYMPWFYLNFPCLGFDRKYIVASAEADFFWDSVGSLHLEQDAWSLYLPQLTSKYTRKRTEAGFNFIFLRREKKKTENFFLTKFKQQKQNMEYYKVPYSMQHSWMLRGGYIALHNPMVPIHYNFTDAGKPGIPPSKKYIDTGNTRDDIFYFGFGRVRKKYFNGILHQTGVTNPHLTSYAFFYADVLFTLQKPRLASQLPYSDDPKDNPGQAAVTTTVQFPHAGFRVGIYGVKNKSNYLPVYYQVEYGMYPNYPVRHGYYLRGSLGINLISKRKRV